MSVAEPRTLRFDTGRVRVESARQPDGLALHLIGDADVLALEPLDVLLKEVHREALELRATNVVVDMRELHFMNSSCFKAFVSWLHDAWELEAPRRYRIRFLTSGSIYWQSRSIHALRTFAPDLVSIEDS